MVGESTDDALYHRPVVFPRGADYFNASFVFPVGAAVPMEAVPKPGYAFIGWSGACSGRGGCRVTVTRARTVTATFARIAYRPDSSIGASRRGPFIGGGVYGVSAWHETLHARVGRFRAVGFIVRLANHGDAPDVFRVHGTPASRGFRIRYFAGSHQVTREVLSGRYVVGIRVGGFTGLRVKVTALGAAKVGATLPFSVLVTSDGNPSRKDAVKGVVTVEKSH